MIIPKCFGSSLIAVFVCWCLCCSAARADEQLYSPYAPYEVTDDIVIIATPAHGGWNGSAGSKHGFEAVTSSVDLLSKEIMDRGVNTLATKLPGEIVKNVSIAAGHKGLTVKHTTLIVLLKYDVLIPDGNNKNVPIVTFFFRANVSAI